MKRDNIALLALFLLTVMAFSLVPVRAFIIPPEGTVDQNYEMFGPRLDQIQVTMYNGLDAMWTALQNGEIDVTDWPLTITWLNAFSTSPLNETIEVTAYGGEGGMYFLDMNLNNNQYLGNPQNPARTNPMVDPAANIQNPCSDVNFRRGVSYLFNRTYFAGVIAGWGDLIYTVMPDYMGDIGGLSYIHPEIRPGGTLEALTYPLSDANADAQFALAKMKVVVGQNGGYRFWDRDDDNICDAGEEIVLHMNVRQDTGRRRAGEHFRDQLIAHNFNVEYHSVTGGVNYQESMLDKHYHFTTFGWINMGPDADWVYDLYNGVNYWDDPESSAPNTQFLNDALTNYWSESIKYNLTHLGARDSAWKFEERFGTIAPQVPLFSNKGYKAHSRTYVGATGPEAAFTGDTWMHMNNRKAFGDNDYFTFLNAYPEGHEFDSGMIMRYGWKEQGYPQHINPLYSEWYWDAEVLGKVYDGLGARNIYTLEWTKLMCTAYEVGTWYDSLTASTKSKVTVHLRPDMYWTDGEPVTVDDIVYSLTEVAYDLIAHGYPPPWSWPTAQQVQSAYIVDPYTVEILYSVQSVYAESWTLGGFYVIPKHIWEHIIEEHDPTAFAADGNVIGSGAWRYVSMTPEVSLLLEANRRGSVVDTDQPGHTPTGPSPGCWYEYPVDIQAYEKSNLAKFLPGTDLNFTVKLTNLNKNGPMTVDKYVTLTKTKPTSGPRTVLNGTLGASFSYSELGIVLAPDTPDYEFFYIDNAYAGKIQINVTIVYQTAPFVGLVSTVIVDPWLTLKEDIGGLLMGSPGFPVPDFKIDGKDITAASYAFGTRPGMLRWSPVADVTGDYKIDGKDITRIAKLFGYDARTTLPLP